MTQAMVEAVDTAAAGRGSSPAGSGPARRRSRRGNKLTGLFFALPAIVLVAVFVLYPIIGTALLSLQQWDGASLTRPFVGFANFAAMVTDPVFWASLERNIIYVLGFFVSVVLGFAFAILLWVRPRGWVVFRTVFLIPEMMGPAIVGLIWLQLWQPVTGGLAGLGTLIHNSWLASSPISDPKQAIWVLVATQVWASTGFFTVVALGGGCRTWTRRC